MARMPDRWGIQPHPTPFAFGILHHTGNPWPSGHPEFTGAIHLGEDGFYRRRVLGSESCTVVSPDDGGLDVCFLPFIFFFGLSIHVLIQ